MTPGRTCSSAAICGVFVVMLCGVAHAAVLPAPEPTDVVSQVTSDAENAVNGVTDQADNVVQHVAPGTDPKHIVDKVVATIKHVAQEVLPPSGAGSGQGDGSDGVTTPPTDQPGSTHNHGHQSNARHRKLQHARGSRTRSASPHNHLVALPAPRESSLVVRTAARGASPQSLVGGIGRQLGRAAKQIAFPALLALLVAAFLVLQNRIDRSDPKLISWQNDHDTELVVFE